MPRTTIGAIEAYILAARGGGHVVRTRESGTGDWLIDVFDPKAQRVGTVRVTMGFWQGVTPDEVPTRLRVMDFSTLSTDRELVVQVQ